MPGNVRVQWSVLFGILKPSGERVCVFVPCLQLLLYLVRYISVVNAHSKLPK
jgi:hypothetical protein